MVDVLTRRKGVPSRVYVHSSDALREMGEELPNIPYWQGRDIESALAEISEKGHPFTLVIEFAKLRESKIAEVSRLAKQMRAKPVEEYLKELVDETLQIGIFPAIAKADGKNWFAPDKWGNKGEVQSYHSVPYKERYYWVISDEGDVQEARIVGHEEDEINFRELRPCAEHLLEQAGYITDKFVTAAVQ